MKEKKKTKPNMTPTTQENMQMLVKQRARAKEET